VIHSFFSKKPVRRFFEKNFCIYVYLFLTTAARRIADTTIEYLFYSQLINITQIALLFRRRRRFIYSDLAFFSENVYKIKKDVQPVGKA